MTQKFTLIRIVLFLLWMFFTSACPTHWSLDVDKEPSIGWEIVCSGCQPRMIIYQNRTSVWPPITGLFCDYTWPGGAWRTPLRVEQNLDDQSQTLITSRKWKGVCVWSNSYWSYIVHPFGHVRRGTEIRLQLVCTTTIDEENVRFLPPLTETRDNVSLRFDADSAYLKFASVFERVDKMVTKMEHAKIQTKRFSCVRFEFLISLMEKQGKVCAGGHLNVSGDFALTRSYEMVYQYYEENQDKKAGPRMSCEHSNSSKGRTLICDIPSVVHRSLIDSSKMIRPMYLIEYPNSISASYSLIPLPPETAYASVQSLDEDCIERSYLLLWSAFCVGLLIFIITPVATMWIRRLRNEQAFDEDDDEFALVRASIAPHDDEAGEALVI